MVLMRTAKSCGPDAPMLASSCAEFFRVATVAIKPVAGESTKETVKPLSREGRTASAEPVCSCAFSFVHLPHETAGAARTRSSPRPLLRVGCALFDFGAERNGKPRTKPCREKERVCLTLPLKGIITLTEHVKAVILPT